MSAEVFIRFPLTRHSVKDSKKISGDRMDGPPVVNPTSPSKLSDVPALREAPLTTNFKGSTEMRTRCNK